MRHPRSLRFTDDIRIDLAHPVAVPRLATTLAALAVDPLAAESSQLAARPTESVPTPSPVPPSDDDTRGGAAPPRRTVIAAGVDGGAVAGLFPKPSPRVSLFAEARFERWAIT